MTFEQKMIGEVLVLAPRKNLVGGDETNALLTAIEQVARARSAKVVMDMSGVNWVSSPGIGLMRKASITCTRSGGWLRLARIGKIVENTLHVTGLIIYFDTFESVEDAVMAPEMSARPPAESRPDARPPKRPEA